ncbi:hypothetical protein PFFCH_01461 [Plasmodium falciparum FCH/4]|uniref:Uncharacterized protein n=1 Tax=Plasmodium falciparum FCH/4 TaxID=1036724 RepID=A0A024VT98_PLAFA|nr:hypothetical protein PFFCH_01461 [Plasmodium falciparum FCH/4]
MIFHKENILKNIIKYKLTMFIFFFFFNFIGRAKN